MSVFFEKSLRICIGLAPGTLRAIKGYELDVVHTQTEFSIGVLGKIAAFMLDLPVVHTYHTMYKDYLHYLDRGGSHSRRDAAVRQLSSEMVRALSRDFCNTSDAVIAPTEKVRDLLASYEVKVPIKVLPSGVSLERFREAAGDPEARRRARAELGVAEDAPLVAFIGRVAKEKSIDMILRALPALVERLPAAKLLIIGEGPERPALEALAGELCPPGSCLFAGSRPWSGIPEYYRAADVFVTASTTETQGLTVLEAMAAEVPVAARRDPSFASMIEDGVDGLLFSDPGQLAEALFLVLTDKARARFLVAAGREKAGEYSGQAFGEKVEAVYEEAIRARASARARRREFGKSLPRAISSRYLLLHRRFRRLIEWLR
jgi:1,2-diacylglycerol 3-alpha-glucosyltransferase